MRWQDQVGRAFSVLSLLAHLVVIVVGINFAVAPWQSEPTTENPDGFAGEYAAWMALCVGLMLALNSTNLGGRLGRWMRGLLIAIGSTLGALFWMASEAATPVTDPQFWRIIGLIWALALLLVAFVLAAGWMVCSAIIDVVREKYD